MKTVTLEYISNKQLEHFIVENHLHSCNNILIQIFTAQNNKKFIKNLRDDVLDLIQNAKIIGTTTCGEISNNGALSNTTVISFSSFQHTKIQTAITHYKSDSFTLGQDTINSFNDYNYDELKLLISFTDGLDMNGEEYLDGISSINSNIIVSGGMAGDNAKFNQTFVFTEKDIIENGSVAAALLNKELNIHTDYSFNWETIGQKHIIEKSIKNRVYKISGMTAVEFYKHYLGSDISKLLPAIGIEFPLVIQKDNLSIARAIVTKHNDGSISFAGNIPEGTEVQFGYGDVEMIIQKSLNNIKTLIEQPIESIFIYSCMARYALLNNDINLEILPLKEIAPISGFFTYGEFFNSGNKNQCSSQLLNQTMTLVAISENSHITNKIHPNIFSKNPAQNNNLNLHRTQALSNLIKRTTSELENANTKLDKKIKNALKKHKQQDETIQVLKTNAQIGDMLEMIIHQWRQPLSAITTAASSAQLYKEMNTLTDQVLDSSLENILSYANNLNTTIEDFRDLFTQSNKKSSSKLSKIITKSLNISAPLIKNHSIKIIQETEDDPIVFITTGLMMQVMINIIKNAIDILVEKNIENPTIKFKMLIKNHKLIIKIMDNAGGIPEDILPYIFDKNFTTKGDNQGTGIGLDMSKVIIESKMRGSLTASNQGNWAIFKIKIPLDTDLLN